MRILLSGLLLGCACFSLLPALARAQPALNSATFLDEAPLRFDRISVDDGLSQQAVYSILQDRHGYMWFGTGNGLNRFDGYSFKTYFHDPAKPEGLGSGRSLQLLEDVNGFLWIGHARGSSGLDRYDPSSDTFKHFGHDPEDSTSLSNNMVIAFYEDRNGALWIGSEELNLFEPEKETFRRIPFPPEMLDPNFEYTTINAIVEDGAGRLWLGTNQGLFRFDPASETFSLYRHDASDPSSLSHDWVSALHVDRQGVLWIGSYGLNRFDFETQSFRRFYMDPAAPEPGEDGMGTGPVRGSNRIKTILEDHTGALWLGTGGLVTLGIQGGSGLYRFDPEREIFHRYGHDSTNPYSLPHDDIQALYEDRQGILWIGTGSAGISKVDRTVQRFTLYDKDPDDPMRLEGDISMAMHLDSNDVLWVGTWNGVLNRLDRESRRSRSYRHDPANPEGLGSGGISAIHRDRQNRLWIGTEAGLQRFEEAQGTFTSYRHDPSNPAGIGSNRINVIMEDRSGKLWIGTYDGGVNRFDEEAGAFKKYVRDRSDSTGLNGNWISSIVEDHQHFIWAATNNGINRYDRQTDAFKAYLPQTFNGIGIFSLYEHPAHPGYLWIGTGGSGLYRLDTKTNRTTLYSMFNGGLPDNMIYCILGDDDGNLWMSTNRGLARLDVDADTWTVYGMDNGIQGLEYDLYACHRGYNGELFFGGINGVNAIRPGDTFANPNPPQVVLSNMRLFNKIVIPGPGSPLVASITLTESVTLKYNQNDLAVDYAGLHYRHPERNLYAYMLAGYDEAWREVGAERRANYTNLSPGHYTFHVRASNSDGVWNEQGASLAVKILPPWWRTTWALILYVLIIVGTVVAVGRSQKRRLIAAERIRAEREKTRAIESTNNELQRALKHLTETQDQLIHIEKMASLGQLTAGIAHELKNPLNFVNNFSALSLDMVDELKTLIEKKGMMADSEIQELFETLKMNAVKINNHGKRADGIIRSMLEHSRTDRGMRKATDINKLVEEFANLTFHGMRAREDGFTVELDRDYDESIGEIEIFAQEIGRVLINLLDNAFYAVNEKRISSNGRYSPRISIKTKKADGYVEINIADNGMGISEEIMERIFEPFFTTKPTGSGTGLGLSLSHDIIVKGHGGELKVESAAGEGAEFTVKLPA